MSVSSNDSNDSGTVSCPGCDTEGMYDTACKACNIVYCDDCFKTCIVCSVFRCPECIIICTSCKERVCGDCVDGTDMCTECADDM